LKCDKEGENEIILIGIMDIGFDCFLEALTEDSNGKKMKKKRGKIYLLFRFKIIFVI